MDFIPHIKYSTFRGVITRRTTPQLKGSGGILDTALQMYKKVDSKVKWKSQENKFVFSSGAEVYLRHFEYLKDKDNYQGLQANEILVDEAQQYEEEQIVYLMSRLRNPSCPQVKPRIKMTCNPLKSSFLCKWIEWYLDEEGYPRKDRDGVVRYFIRKDNTMIWADTKEELIEKYSTPLFTPTPMSFCFISALITDNPALLEAQPEYLGWLEGLGRVEQARLRWGCWYADEEASGYWKKEWCEVVDKPLLKVKKKVRSWDVAGTIPSEMSPDPDYTCGVLMSKDDYGNYYVEDVVRFRERHGGVFQRILETAREDGDDVLVVLPQDPNAAGKAYAATMVRDLAEKGFYAKTKATNQSKVTRFAPFCAASEAGSIKIVKGDWNEAFFIELEGFDGGRKKGKHDDFNWSSVNIQN
jgi:predicted phage terminase large subunit-like protein